MSFIGEISSLSQTASNKMKGTAEYVRISGKITDLEKSLNQCYLQVGKAVCTTETTGRTPATEEIIKNAKQMQQALQELQGQLLLLKGNVFALYVKIRCAVILRFVMRAELFSEVRQQARYASIVVLHWRTIRSFALLAEKKWKRWIRHLETASGYAKIAESQLTPDILSASTVEHVRIFKFFKNNMRFVGGAV